MPAERRYLTTREAARELGVSQRALQQWIKSGAVTVAYFTPGGHARLDVERIRSELRERLPRGEDADG